MVIYEGIFFDDDTVNFIRKLEKRPLAIPINEVHCTFKFRPRDDEIFDELVGKEIELSIIGYGCNGNNSGFEVELPADIMHYYINYDKSGKLNRPHITVSLSQGAKSLNTKNLKFDRLPKPYKIKGRFGYWIKKENSGHISYSLYKKR